MFGEDKLRSDRAMARAHICPTPTPLLSFWHQAALWNTTLICSVEHSNISGKQIDFFDSDFF